MLIVERDKNISASQNISLSDSALRFMEVKGNKMTGKPRLSRDIAISLVVNFSFSCHFVTQSGHVDKLLMELIVSTWNLFGISKHY